jgi:hypothetical protein
VGPRLVLAFLHEHSRQLERAVRAWRRLGMMVVADQDAVQVIQFMV